jgi:integrase
VIVHGAAGSSLRTEDDWLRWKKPLPGSPPARRVYDLRHTFATFALRAGISTFDLSRYIGASLTMIDRHYGHLARDGRDHAIKLLDAFTDSEVVDVHSVDAAWTSKPSTVVRLDNGKAG